MRLVGVLGRIAHAVVVSSSVFAARGRACRAVSSPSGPQAQCPGRRDPTSGGTEKADEQPYRPLR